MKIRKGDIFTRKTNMKYSIFIYKISKETIKIIRLRNNTILNKNCIVEEHNINFISNVINRVYRRITPLEKEIRGISVDIGEINET